MREVQEELRAATSNAGVTTPQCDETFKSTVAGALMDLSSVPFSAVKRLVQNYVEVHRPQYPCVSASLVENIVDRIRSEVDDTNTFFSSGKPATSGLGHFEYFVLFITLAISAMTLTWADENQARSASEAFFGSAKKHLQALDDNDEIQALQISLLLVHYAQQCPERADNWTCISHAIRIVLDLGLHKGSPDALSLADQRQRRQLFWVAYGMERSLCSVLRLPLSFSEESISTPPPADFRPDHLFTSDDIEKESSANHIYLYRALETEAHRVLHLEHDLEIFRHVDVSDWISDISSRLARWYAKAQSYTQYNMLEFKHVQYNHLLLRLHRPTPRLRVRSDEDRRIVLDASAALIEDYLSQERRRRLFYPFHGAHILFEAAAISLEACWWLKGAAEPLRSVLEQMLCTAVPNCLDLLTKMGRRWNAAQVSAKRLRPILADVTAACGFANYENDGQSASAISDEVAIVQQLENLLFPDGPLIWDTLPSGEQDSWAAILGTGNTNFADGNDVFFDDLELFSWQPNWGLVFDDASTISNPGVNLEGRSLNGLQF
ncbi:uncharacterized protein A1O9_02065 [Exophiala aquamarina CBS 119918]|uniref:Xylanolytic transcriptional activator regulatory domain-containing protein n=1 Tax=Exophiala aquamarina CBS 119918 TaxID=1182545 RepID=A0A072PK68_9EURO|nr:uncharacterized protein A1O9_02065 [Exophiala aquamarina CBS 119918]KEF60504.1 hypothetical protein A1O9_02065 [Exophiala aquamarina CBS 119918]